GDDLPALAEHTGRELLGHHDRVIAVGLAYDRVALAGVHGDRRVGHQRPRRGGPDQQVRAGQQWAGAVRHGTQREPDGDPRVGDLPAHVGLAHLAVGQRGLAPGAVRADPEVLDKQALVKDDLQRPPNGFDVVRVHGAVGPGQVDPVAKPVGEVLERVDVPEHRFTAALVECGDPVTFDVLLAGQP